MASEQKVGGGSGAASNVCGDCGKRCAGPAFLQQHVTKMHLTEYACETEGCTFKTKDRKLFKAHTHSKETKAAVSKPKAVTFSGKSGSRKRTSTSALSQLYDDASPSNPVAEALDNLLGGKKPKMEPVNEEEDELLDISDDDDENDTDYVGQSSDDDEEVEEEEDDEDDDDDDAEDKDEDEKKEEEEEKDDDLKKLKEFINSLSSLPGKASAFYKLTKKLKRENDELKKEQEAAGKKIEDGNSPTEFQMEALAKHLSAEDLQKIREFKDHEWFNRAIMLIYAQALRDFNAK